MAARTPTLNLGDDDGLPAWQTVIGLSQVMDTSRLTIIGGLMVYLHASRGGVQMPRSTDDADVLLDMVVHRDGLSAFSRAVKRLGFELRREAPYAYRFHHADGRKVDVMVPDHLPSGIRPRLDRKPALEAPGGRQAIDRRDVYTLEFRGGQLVTVGVPDEIGALVAKGAAFLIDQRDRDRHLDDAATLLASITDASELDYTRSSTNDRRRLRAIRERLSDETAPHWIDLDSDSRTRGRLNLTLVMRAMGVEVSP
jgi:hypothetical protein